MKTLPRILPVLCVLLALPALAQRPPSGNSRRTPRPIGSPAAPPTGQAPAELPTSQTQPAQVAQGAGARDRPADAAHTEATPPVGGTRAQPSRGTTRDGETTLRPKPTCEQVRRNAKFNIFLKGVAIEDLVQTVSDATCKTFILPESVRGKITIVGPENGQSEVTADQFYRAFLAALDANGLAVYQSGQYLKIVDKRSAKQSPIPLVGPEETPVNAEQMVTAIFKVKNVEMEPLRGVLQQLVSKDGDTIAYPPDTIIVNDLGSNIRRLQRVVEQLDERATSADMRVIQVQYASAQDIATTVQKIFETPAKTQTSTPVTRGRRAGNVQPSTTDPAGAGTSTGTGGGAATLSQIIADERTNKLIIVASPAGFERIDALIREVDVPISGEGRINVHYLNNANAEDLAATLSGLTQGSGGGAASPAAQAARMRGGAGGAPGGTTTAGGSGTAELFSGEVKISADAATNSLVIVASQSDYRNVLRVIEKLDIARRQVFIEAVIMEVNLNRNGEFGIQLHTGVPVSTPAGAGAGLVGTKYGSGLPPSFSLTNLVNFSGLVAGLSGPAITSPALTSLGLTIPQFGLVLHAMQTSSDVNVLSTPHILTSDNEEAEITVGQNVPFQAGYAPSSVGAGLGGAAGGALGALGGLGGLGGLNSLYAPIARQNVELKLTVKPQINDSDYVRLSITQQTEEIASNDPVLGPTTSKRSVKTVIVAKDQETVVLGGIMQDRTIESVSKVPVLGDLPILGYLFRDSTQQKVKTNLLLVLTPYIIRDQSDFRRIFEKKLEERQKFVEQFYGQIPDYEVAMDFSRKAGPLGRMTQTLDRERSRVENGGRGDPGTRVISPGQVSPVRPAGAGVELQIDGSPAEPRGVEGDAFEDGGDEGRDAPPVEEDAPRILESTPPVEQERIQPSSGEDVDG